MPPEPLIAYIDTSAMAAVAFEEPTAPFVAQRLAGFPRWISSNLLEAELRAAYARERRDYDANLTFNIAWISPDGPLAAEMAAALQVGYLRGADLWHIATALYAAQTLRTPLAFMTLDGAQQKVAAGLGFVV